MKAFDDGVAKGSIGRSEIVPAATFADFQRALVSDTKPSQPIIAGSSASSQKKTAAAALDAAALEMLAKKKVICTGVTPPLPRPFPSLFFAKSLTRVLAPRTG